MSSVYSPSSSPVISQTVSGGAPPPGFPRLTGWGGMFADGFDGGSTDPTNLQTVLNVMKSRGYNAFRCMILDTDFPHTCSLQSVINAVNTAKANNMWIIIDHHGYTADFDTDPFWDQVIAAVKDLYTNIVWEPQNEPVSDPQTLGSAYQNWVNKLRATGDTHWFIISPGQQTFPSSGNPFPSVQDPLNKIVYSYHEYYFHQYHGTWTFADADNFADTVAAPAVDLVAQGKTVCLTEFGADPGSGAPNIVASGSAGYAPESLEYTKRLINNLKAIGAGYILWTAGNWTNTPGAGATGALNVWGNQLPLPP